ncbi:MAG TPA: ABC transporter substrate-binding protein, partial [Dehalococcoidia bacterium]|nr:ABC transporter substrate-binding protein [Dehalococcoidia bacterium]
MVQEKGYWTQQLSRRRALRGAALTGAGLTAATLIGCGGRQETPAATQAVQQPKRGGILTHQNAHETQGRPLDPHRSTRTAAQGFRLFYQSLLRYHPETYVEGPELAQQWEQPSELEYIFTLQPGVHWHNKPPANGRALTIDDVVFSLNRARTRHPEFQSRSLLEGVERLEAVDASHLRITVKEPDAPFLFKLAADGLTIMAPEVVEKADKFTTAAEVVGTGPFIMTSVQEGVGAEYVRNPAYWKPGLPYLDGLRTKHFANDQLAYAAFLGGELDVSGLPGNEVKNYLERQG